jgi:pimeloyl-ACP methyl ester carboxylesterase
MRLFPALLLIAALPVPATAQVPQPQAARTADASRSYTVFLRSTPIGQEEVAVVRQADGWIIRGSNRLAPPIDAVTRIAEIRYTAEWRPVRMVIEGTTRGQALSIKTTFADGNATSEISVGSNASSKTDAVAADTIVLPNGFLGSYAALARRLLGLKPGAELRGYIAPQLEVPLRVQSITSERIETPDSAISASRYAVIVHNPAPIGEVQMNVWIDPAGDLLRMSVPVQMLEVAREDVASAATRTTAFSIPGEETVHIPAVGFNLAASVARPQAATGRLPVLILIGGSGPADRDGYVAGIPILGQLARDLVKAGFMVVRYDKRGVGQSGGRTETSTIADYAEDVRAIVTWLERERKDVDRRRIGLVGHSEGGWVALTVAARDRRVAAVAVVAAPGTTGNELVLEQQRHVLARANTPDAERDEKIRLQQQINTAVLKGTGWETIPSDLRRAADTPWFHSLLTFDPARVIRDVRQPLLIVQGSLDTQVRPYHADRLAQLGRARDRKVATELVHIAGVNHLLVTARTGEVDEYASLTGSDVSADLTGRIAAWMTAAMPPRR